VWGQGDVQAFQGAPTALGDDAGYDGDMSTSYLGVDARLTERWLVGMAVSRSTGDADWRVGASRGRLRTNLTALHPYVQWSDGTRSVWAMAGGGWGDGGAGEGEAENLREATGRVGASGLGLRLGLVEYRERVGEDDAETGVELVEIAHRRHPGRVLGQTAAVGKPGGAVVAGARIDS